MQISQTYIRGYKNHLIYKPWNITFLMKSIWLDVMIMVTTKAYLQL